MKRVKAARSTAVVVRLHSEERELLHLNAGVHGLSMSDYIRQTCLGIRLRRTPEEKRRLHELAAIRRWGAQISISLPHFSGRANTYKGTAETVEVLAALADIEKRILRFADAPTAEDVS